jgi:hypothetical protein
MLVKEWQMEARISQRMPILEMFDKLYITHTKDKRHRMRTIYSYDVRDCESYRNLFVVEEKMREYKRRKEMEQKSNSLTPGGPGDKSPLNQSALDVSIDINIMTASPKHQSNQIMQPHNQDESSKELLQNVDGMVLEEYDGDQSPSKTPNGGESPPKPSIAPVLLKKSQQSTPKR